MRSTQRQLRVQLSPTASNELSKQIDQTGMTATEVVNKLLIDKALEAGSKGNGQASSK